MKKVEFLGTSLDDILQFSDTAKREAGYQLYRVQTGKMPQDFKPMPSIGSGVVEIRIKEPNNIYRVIYTAKIAETIYVLHAFVKKTQKTSQADINLAKARLAELKRK